MQSIRSQRVGHNWVTFTWLHSAFLAVPCGLQDLSSPRRDWVKTRAVKAPSPNHLTTREFPLLNVEVIDFLNSLWSFKIPSQFTGILYPLGFHGGSYCKESAYDAGDLGLTPELGRSDPLEKGIVTHSSIHAWRILWTEESGGLQAMGSHSWETNTFTFYILHQALGPLMCLIPINISTSLDLLRHWNFPS